MPKSVINPDFEFNEQMWVVSVLSTDPKKKHFRNLIIVEGIKPLTGSLSEEKRFIGQYSIALTFQEESDSMNNKGLIPKIQIVEGSVCTTDYRKHPTRTYYVDPKKAEEMINSIKKDQGSYQPPSFSEGLFPFNQYLGYRCFLLTSIERYQKNWCNEKMAIAEIDKDPFSVEGKPTSVRRCIIS